MDKPEREKVKYMPTIDEILERVPSGLYMAHLSGPALRHALGGESEIEAWYLRESKEQEDGTYRDECWFLTPAALVNVVITANSLTAKSYARSAVRSIQTEFEFVDSGPRRLHVKGVSVVLACGTESETIDISPPTRDYRNEWSEAYWELTERLGKMTWEAAPPAS